MTNTAQSNHAATSPTNSKAVRSGDWLCAGWRFTQHALQRYRERTGCSKSDETVMGRLAVKLANRKSLGRRQWYASGWVFVLRGNLVITVMRPREASVLRRVFKAHNAERSEPEPRQPQ